MHGISGLLRAMTMSAFPKLCNTTVQGLTDLGGDMLQLFLQTIVLSCLGHS